MKEQEDTRVDGQGNSDCPRTAADLGETPPLMTIGVFREDDGRFCAVFMSGDAKVAGSGAYSSTPFGALAEVYATLLKVAEDERGDWSELFASTARKDRW